MFIANQTKTDDKPHRGGMSNSVPLVGSPGSLRRAYVFSVANVSPGRTSNLPVPLGYQPSRMWCGLILESGHRIEARALLRFRSVPMYREAAQAGSLCYP